MEGGTKILIFRLVDALNPFGNYLGEEPEPKKILIRGVNWIGDAVLTTPAIKALRRAFPDAYISLLVRARVSEIFEGNPDINEIILYEDGFNTIQGKTKLAGLLRTKKFDMAILLQNAFDAALIAWLGRIPERIGYSRDWRRPLLTKAVPVRRKVQSSENKNILPQHHVYYYLNLLKESLNIESDDIEPAIHLKKEEAYEARSLLNSKLPRGLAPQSRAGQTPTLNQTVHGELIIGINPGATYGSAKRWNPERFAKLIRRIINELNGRVILFGSKSEMEIANKIIKAVHSTPHASPILNIVGKTNLRQLMALISECDAFVTNDSGPMHIASAMFVPTVAIFGSTDPAVTGPIGKGHRVIYKGLPCSPCLRRECPEKHLNCMEDITVDDVFDALKVVLPKERAVFLDRDGTIIEDVGYLNTFNNLKILPDVAEGIERLKSAGFRIICITNQSGIARGIVREKFVKESADYLQKTLGIDSFYFCPHHPDNNCICRKPEPLLLRKARTEHGINLRASYLIGDKVSDVLAAKHVGARSILLKNEEPEARYVADFVAKNFKEAVEWIMEKAVKKN